MRFSKSEKRRDDLRRSTTLLRVASRQQLHQALSRSCDITVASGRVYSPNAHAALVAFNLQLTRGIHQKQTVVLHPPTTL